jgi:hypothetical protein
MSRIEAEFNGKKWVPHYRLLARQLSIMSAIGLTKEKVLENITEMSKTIIL